MVSFALIGRGKLRRVVPGFWFLFTVTIGFGIEDAPVYQKYKKEVATLFDSLEVTDVTLPATVRVDGKLQPTLTLRNKEKRELLVPVAMGIAPGYQVLGFPSWYLEGEDKKKRRLLGGGSLTHCDRIAAGGLVKVDGFAFVPELLGILPGEYKLYANFHSSIEDYRSNVLPALASKPVKLIVLPKEANASKQVAADRFSSPRFRLGGFPELSSQSIKAGAPLGVRLELDLTLSDTRVLPPAIEELTPVVHLTYCVYSQVGTNVKLTPMSRLYAQNRVDLEPSQWTELCRQGVLVWTPLVETLGMAPGNYLILCRLGGDSAFGNWEYRHFTVTR